MRGSILFLLAVALAGMASAQISLSGPIWSEEKVKFEAPAALQLYLYAYEGRTLVGSYNASSGWEPAVINRVHLDVMLINLNLPLERLWMKFIHPSLLADTGHLAREARSDTGWVEGQKSDAAILFRRIDMSQQPLGHNVVLLRGEYKNKTRTRVLFILNFVSVGREKKDQAFALVNQALRPEAQNIPTDRLMAMGLFRGFSSIYAELPPEAAQVLSQVIPAQNQSAQSGGSALPPDLPLPNIGGGGGSALPPDLPLPMPSGKKISVAVGFSESATPPSFKDGEVGDDELSQAMANSLESDDVVINGKQAVIYVVSDKPFSGKLEGDRLKKPVPLDVYRKGEYCWARLVGPSSALIGARLVVDDGNSRRIVTFKGGNN